VLTLCLSNCKFVSPGFLKPLAKTSAVATLIHVFPKNYPIWWIVTTLCAFARRQLSLP
jgi:hypothetical protein